VITDVVKTDAKQAAAIIERASDGASISDLATVPSSVWETLAEGSRFPATFGNVTEYIDDIGMEFRLGSLLARARTIESAEGEAEGEKLALAIEILIAKDSISSAATRSSLIESLELSEFIDAESVPTEEGELVGHLIGNNIIEDDIESFARIPTTDWLGREYAIKQSAQFPTFSTPIELPVANVGHLFKSEIITAPVKAVILDRIDEFTVGATQPILMSVADYALASGRGLTVATITRIAGNIGIDRTLQLIKPHLLTLTIAELTPILNGLGGEFRKLAGATGKRPKFNKTDSLLELVARIESLGYIGSTEDVGSQLRVNMRRP